MSMDVYGTLTLVAKQKQEKPIKEEMLESVVVCEAPLVWYGMNTLLKVIEMINLNKAQKKDS